MTDIICDGCGKTIAVGDWPFCKGNPSDHINDGAGHLEPFKPGVDEHILSEGRDFGFDSTGTEKVWGTYIGSREERNRIMKENGIINPGRKRGDRGQWY